jgi:hypothetical protein
LHIWHRRLALPTEWGRHIRYIATGIAAGKPSGRFGVARLGRAEGAVSQNAA